MNPNRPFQFKTYGNHYGPGHSTVIQGSPEDGELPPFLDTAVIRCKTPRIVKPRVLCFTTSLGRPSHLMACIRQVQDQTYPCDHAVFLNYPGAISPQDPHNFISLIQQMVVHPASNLYLSFGASGRQHYNYTSAVKTAPYHNYHLFLKIDDDDFYSDEYVADCVQDWISHQWDFSGCSSDGYIEDGTWKRAVRLKSLGLNARDIELGVLPMMPPTYALSAAAMVKVMGIHDDGEHYEDMQWRWAIAADKSLKMARRHTTGFSYHLHDKNVSRPQRKPTIETERYTVTSTLSWAVGVLTAPRATPLLSTTLDSLQKAGFDNISIFAEPGSPIPPECNLPVKFNKKKLGPFLNMYHSVSALLTMYPDSNCIAIFQDDVTAPAGLRHWCDTQFWPNGQQVLSLFTVSVYLDDKVGWRTLDLGYWRTFGAQAIVMSRDACVKYLQSPIIHKYIDNGYTLGADAQWGEWASAEYGGVALHTPSLISHIGSVSTLRPWELGPISYGDGPKTVEEIATWKPDSNLNKVGLIGWNTAQGLGYLNRNIVKHLPIDRWIIPRHRTFKELDVPQNVTTHHVELNASTDSLRKLCEGLHWMMFCELPYIEDFSGTVRSCGTPIVCIPMWEWLYESLEWLKYVDLFICPNQHCYDMLSRWRKKLGYKWDMAMIPWPIDTDEFVFQQRHQCRSFLFNNGTGGGMAFRRDGGRHQPRKGVETVINAAKLVPHIPVFIRTQVTDLPNCPPNVTILTEERDNLGLYSVGDIALQPSLYEGIGLQCLEAQACGLPLITTNSPPMTEYKAIRTVQCSLTEGRCYGDRWIPVAIPDPRDLARHMADLYESDISQASAAARTFIEEEHSWKTAVDKFLKLVF